MLKSLLMLHRNDSTSSVSMFHRMREPRMLRNLILRKCLIDDKHRFGILFRLMIIGQLYLLPFPLSTSPFLFPYLHFRNYLRHHDNTIATAFPTSHWYSHFRSWSFNLFSTQVYLTQLRQHWYSFLEIRYQYLVDLNSLQRSHCGIRSVKRVLGRSDSRNQRIHFLRRYRH